MICEIWYPRIEIPLSEFKIPEDAGFDQKSEVESQKPANKKKFWAWGILLIGLLLPAICIMPMRSEFIEYSKNNQSEILKNKVDWEDRFNLGAGIIFGTSMLWILIVVTMMLTRENNIKKLKL